MIKLIDALTGVDVLVADDRVNEYLAMGYKPIAETIENEPINPPEAPKEIPEEIPEEKTKAAKKTTKSSKKK